MQANYNIHSIMDNTSIHMAYPSGTWPFSHNAYLFTGHDA